MVAGAAMGGGGCDTGVMVPSPPNLRAAPHRGAVANLGVPPHHGAAPSPGAFWSRLVSAAGAVVLALVAVVAPGATVGAQTSLDAAPLGLQAPAWSSPELPAEMRVASLWVLPGPDGLPSAVDVRFAGAFTPPPGRWRVSVVVGDPSGSTQRLSMVWDGSAATGVAEQVEGLAVEELGPLTASVNPAGSVVVGVPAGVLDAAGDGLVWAEVVLGADLDPTLVVRSPLYPRAVLAGVGAPGLLQGSTLGQRAPADPGAASPGPLAPVVDTGVPSVVELGGGVLRVDRGAAPADAPGGGQGSVVDLVTLVGTPGGTDAPPSGPQVRIDLLGGSVELGLGSVLGPLGPAVGDGSIVGPAASWLRQPADGGAAPATGPVEVDVAGAFAALGEADPGEALAVSVTRVVTGADGSVVVTPGVIADRSWLDPGGDAAVTAPAPEPGDAGEGTGAPVVAIVVGTAFGVVAVGAAMVLAGWHHRRRHPGPEDDWLPPSAAAEAAAAGAPRSLGAPPAPPPPPPSAPPPPPVARLAGGAAPPSAPPPSAVPPPAAAPPPVAGAAGAPGVAGTGEGADDLDEDIEQLTERLRRLRDEG